MSKTHIPNFNRPKHMAALLVIQASALVPLSLLVAAFVLYHEGFIAAVFVAMLAALVAFYAVVRLALHLAEYNADP